MKTTVIALSAAALALGGTAYAAPGMMGHGPKGDMTRADAQAQAAEHFARMDANGDGKLDPADREAMRAKMFDRIDADGNGAISREEFDAMHRGGRDGEAREGKRGHRMGMHRGMRGHHRGGMGMMKQADTDGDGAISQAEFTAGALAMFDKADADRNGTVTDAERKAAHQAMRAQWKAQAEQRRAERQAN
jgi:Ca2+-binding EF-hand superfamily protein